MNTISKLQKPDEVRSTKKSEPGGHEEQESERKDTKTEEN